MRRAALLGAVAIALGLTVAPPIARPALAAEPLRIEAEATYAVDPEAGRIHVVIDVTATNLKPDEGTTTFYYEEIFFGVQPEATRIRASDSGGSLDATVRRREDYTAITVRLRSPLFYGDTGRFAIGYDLPGGEPRSESPIRVGAAFATFGVWAWGDPGRGSVEVRLPAGFEGQVIGDEMTIDEVDGVRVLRARPPEPYRFHAIVDAENTTAYARRRLSLDGDVELVILAWPEDDAWSGTVTSTLESGMPVLRELIGLDWPVLHDLEVRERYTPALEGYAGVFYVDESIDVSEDLDPLVIVHEVSHAWFNDDLFTGRWIAEGLAQEYAWRVLADSDEAGPAASRPSPEDAAAVALTTWSHPGAIRDQETDDAERYGYAASWWVVHVAVDAAGEERMRWAFESAVGNTTAYLGAGPPEEHLGPDGFARFYDLVEDVAGPPSAQLDEAFRTFVLSSEQVPLLDDRRDARAAYRDLLAAGEGWLPGWYVRRPLDAWQFALAAGRMDEAEAVLELRDEVAAAASALELRPDDALRLAYESARADFTAASAIGREQLDALGAIDEARLRLAAEPDVLTAVGLIGADPAAPYDDARGAFAAGDLELAVGFAATSMGIIAAAAAAGQQRVLAAAAGALAVILVAALLLLRRRRRRRATALAIALGATPGPVAGPTEPYATLAPDRDDPPEPPAGAPLEGGGGEGGSPDAR